MHECLAWHHCYLKLNNVKKWQPRLFACFPSCVRICSIMRFKLDFVIRACGRALTLEIITNNIGSFGDNNAQRLDLTIGAKIWVSLKT